MLITEAVIAFAIAILVAEAVYISIKGYTSFGTMMAIILLTTVWFANVAQPWHIAIKENETRLLLSITAACSEETFSQENLDLCLNKLQLLTNNRLEVNVSQPIR